MTDEELAGVLKENPDAVCRIVVAALRLEREMYRGDGNACGDRLFHLRKALESIWGHDLPEL